MTGFLVAISGLCLVVLPMEAWIGAQIRDQQRRLDGRLDALAARLAAPPAADPEREKLLNRLRGEIAPRFTLPATSGARMSLDALLASSLPVMLVFVAPQCGPCYELLPDIGGWQRVYGDRLTIALISTGDPHTNVAMTAEYGIHPVLVQEELELVSAYGINQAPAAVLIRPDGLVAAGPRYGTDAIRQLMAETLGLRLPDAPARAGRLARVGEPAPALRRPSLAGNVIDFAGVRESPTLVLFWSPGCQHCAALLPEMHAWEARATGPRLLIVSRGSAALNRDTGLISPIVLDDDRSLAAAFDVTGTPAALLIDERGIVASNVARGERAVRALAARLWATAPADAA